MYIFNSKRRCLHLVFLVDRCRIELLHSIGFPFSDDVMQPQPHSMLASTLTTHWRRLSLTVAQSSVCLQCYCLHLHANVIRIRSHIFFIETRSFGVCMCMRCMLCGNKNATWWELICRSINKNILTRGNILKKILINLVSYQFAYISSVELLIAVNYRHLRSLVSSSI